MWYALGQTLIPLAIATWVFLRHRDHFRLVRNVTLLQTVLALASYELFPTTPPRLTTGLTYAGHPFHFLDTIAPLIGNGTFHGLPIAYNPYSAMPSLHMTWALIVAMAVILCSRHLMVRI